MISDKGGRGEGEGEGGGRGRREEEGQEERLHCASFEDENPLIEGA